MQIINIFAKMSIISWSPFLFSFELVDPKNSSTKTSFDKETSKETKSMTNSMTSFATGYTQTTVRNRRRGIIEVDPNADILRLNVRIATCAVILLQEVI